MAGGARARQVMGKEGLASRCQLYGPLPRARVRGTGERMQDWARERAEGSNNVRQGDKEGHKTWQDPT